MDQDFSVFPKIFDINSLYINKYKIIPKQKAMLGALLNILYSLPWNIIQIARFYFKEQDFILKRFTYMFKTFYTDLPRKSKIKMKHVYTKM